jgi:predicted phosphodiesterase
MRLAIVSDIHGNLPALQAVVRDIKRRGVDAVINLGDSLSGPLMPLETAQYLMAQDWLHLAGNHERQILAHATKPGGASDAFAYSQLGAKELAWIASLTPRMQYTPEVLLCHGTPESDLEYFLETVEPTHVRVATRAEVDARLGAVQAELIACGHTHVPRAVRASTGQLIVNPGSVGLQAYEDMHPFAHVIENGSPDARYAIVERHTDGWVATLICVPYDYRAMARLASDRQRPDWAIALSSGYMRTDSCTPVRPEPVEGRRR